MQWIQSVVSMRSVRTAKAKVVVDIPHKSEPPFELSYDAEWFAILKETNHLLNTTPDLKHMPAQFFSDRYDYSVTLEEISAIRAAFGDDLKVPLNFRKTVPAYNPAKPIRNAQQPNMCINPQTTELCTKLGITDQCVVLSNGNTASPGGNSGDVSIGEDEDDPTYTSFMLDDSSTNPEEISLDADDDSGTEDEPKEDDADVSKNRTRLSLSLPPVKGGERSSSTSSGLVSDGGDSPMKVLSFPDPSDGGFKGGLTTSTPLVPRVIKRRNLDVYSSSQDEDTVSSSDGQGSSSLDSGESSNKEVGSDKGSPGLKKIKRRNQAIYSADNDDDEN